MITIDSQIWIYFLDDNAQENKNVSKWFIGEHNDGVLFSDDIILSMVVPIEVGHVLYKVKSLDPNAVEQILSDFLAIDKCQFIDIDRALVEDAFTILNHNVSSGVGARDSLILATMNKYHVKTISSNDKNILSLQSYRRIDPIFDPPLILEEGEMFDQVSYTQMLARLKK